MNNPIEAERLSPPWRTDLEDAIDCAGGLREDHEVVAVSAGSIRQALDALARSTEGGEPDEVRKLRDQLENEHGRYQALWAAMSRLYGYGLPAVPYADFVNVVNGDLLDLDRLVHDIPCPLYLSTPSPRVSVGEIAQAIDALPEYAAEVMDEQRLWLARRIATVVARLSPDGAPLRVQSEGWVSVPVEPTEAMQHAYFDEIDRNLKRVETDPGFGRFSNHRLAYRAMLAALPTETQGGGL